MSADMSRDADRAWLAFHIFHHGDQDALLRRCIQPLVTQLRRGAMIGDYFFVRYWNGGPHVRLRLKAIDEQDAIRVIVAESVGDFLARYPADLALTAEDYASRAQTLHHSSPSAHEDEIEPLQPPDSIQVRPYVYEGDRYGRWNAARNATERHFRFSSDLAMFIIAQTEQRIDARLTTALYLGAVTAHALGADARATVDVLRKASETLGRVVPEQQLFGADIFHAHGFPDHDDLRAQISPLITSIMRGTPCAKDQSGLGKVLSAWRDDLRRTLLDLRSTAPSSTDHSRLSLVAIDYMHMLNNRLGVPIDQECFAYKLIADALCETAG